MLRSRERVIEFMECHVFVVWDFMCLLQNLKRLCYEGGSGYLWQPPTRVSYESLRLLNEIILSEETDQLPDGTHSSHLDLYLMAMREIGANTRPFESFLRDKDFNRIPEPARSFVRNTFEIINTHKVHILASSFAYGRELIIPDMFMQILDQLDIQAPLFKYYLSRHIDLDGNEHGHKAERLVNELASKDPIKQREVEWAKNKSLEARNKLWKELSV